MDEGANVQIYEYETICNRIIRKYHELDCDFVSQDIDSISEKVKGQNNPLNEIKLRKARKYGEAKVNQEKIR